MHRRTGEIADRIVQVVHAHRDTRRRELEDFFVDHGAVFALEDQAKLARTRNAEIGRLILVAEGMTADDDRVRPARDQTGDVLDDDRLAEHHATQDVADRAVRRLPHLLEAEFLDARFVGGDRRALHRDAVLLRRLGGIDRHLVFGRIAVLDAEVVIIELDVEIRLDEAFADPFPNDARHFVAVDLHDGRLHLNLGHMLFLQGEFACASRHKRHADQPPARAFGPRALCCRNVTVTPARYVIA